VSEPQVQGSAAGPVHNKCEQDDGEDYYHHQKKNTTIPGRAYPATVLALATASGYSAPPELSITGSSDLVAS
jgi:hypothetical protein